MKIRSTPHAHTTFVDGKSSAEEMVRAAIARGFQSLGFSEHARQPIDPDYCLNDETEKAYIREVQRLKARYAGDIRIWLGCERDLCSTADPKDFEYTIGSSHYFIRRGQWYAADGSSEMVAETHRLLFAGDGIAMAREYYDNFARYIAQSPPDIIGHLDVLTKNNEKLRIFDTESKAYREIVFRTLEAIYPHCDLMEINTGRIARGYGSMPYPEPFILKRWREMGGKMIVSSDCHDARFIDCGYDLCDELLLQAGYRTAWVLGTGDDLFEEYPL